MPQVPFPFNLKVSIVGNILSFEKPTVTERYVEIDQSYGTAHVKGYVVEAPWLDHPKAFTCKVSLNNYLFSRTQEGQEILKNLETTREQRDLTRIKLKELESEIDELENQLKKVLAC